MTDLGKCQCANILKGYASLVTCVPFDAQEAWCWQECYSPQRHTHTHTTSINDLFLIIAFELPVTNAVFMNLTLKLFLLPGNFSENGSKCKVRPESGVWVEQNKNWAIAGGRNGGKYSKFPQSCNSNSIKMFFFQRTLNHTGRLPAKQSYTEAPGSHELPLPFLHILNCI